MHFSLTTCWEVLWQMHRAFACQCLSRDCWTRPRTLFFRFTTQPRRTWIVRLRGNLVTLLSLFALTTELIMRTLHTPSLLYFNAAICILIKRSEAIAKSILRYLWVGWRCSSTTVRIQWLRRFVQIMVRGRETKRWLHIYWLRTLL